MDLMNNNIIGYNNKCCWPWDCRMHLIRELADAEEGMEKFDADVMRLSLADAGDGIEDANFDKKTANTTTLPLAPAALLLLGPGLLWRGV
jgi:hypothetical protein